MSQEMTESQKMLLRKYAGKIESKSDEMILLTVGMGANAFGFEQEISEFLSQHPEATFQALYKYAEQFFPELEIVDDELDDEDD